MTLSKLFGKKLKEIRESKGLTQQELAELCDMQTNSIGMIEIGQRAASFATVEILADKLGVDYNELFNFKEQYSMERSDDKLISDLYKEVKNFDNNMLKYMVSHAKSIRNLVKKEVQG